MAAVAPGSRTIGIKNWLADCKSSALDIPSETGMPRPENARAVAAGTGPAHPPGVLFAKLSTVLSNGRIRVPASACFWDSLAPSRSRLSRAFCAAASAPSAVLMRVEPAFFTSSSHAVNGFLAAGSPEARAPWAALDRARPGVRFEPGGLRERGGSQPQTDR